VTGCDLWTTAGKSRPPPSVNNKRGSRLVDEKRLDKNTISQILLLHAAFKLCPEYMLNADVVFMKDHFFIPKKSSKTCPKPTFGSDQPVELPKNIFSVHKTSF